MATLLHSALVSHLMPQSAEEAPRHMQQGHHMGKIVLTMRDADGKIKIGSTPVRGADQVKVDGSASYLLAGGLGGIATVVAQHLGENGARRLVCLSRNPGSKPEDVDTIKELESMGCEVILVKGSLINKNDILNAVHQAPNLKGVLHAPMLLADESFRNMTLYEAIVDTGIDLDFFVFLSSMSGPNGEPGQANYAGANTFLDAFAEYRNNMGLVASFIDIGYAARDDALLQQLITNGYWGVTQPEMIEAFMAASSYPAIGRQHTKRTACPSEYVCYWFRLNSLSEQPRESFVVEERHQDGRVAQYQRVRQRRRSRRR